MIANSQLRPLPYQVEGVRRIEQCKGRVLLADEMGLGKTLQTLWTLQRNPSWLPALVVSPASVKYNWSHEAAHIGLQSSICEGRTPDQWSRRDLVFRSPLTIINYDILHHWMPNLLRQGFNTLVFDECHMLQNLRTKRTKAAMELADGVRHVMMLSGTPLTNRPAELWPALNILWPNTFDSFWSFAQDYCKPKWTPWGWQYKGAENVQTLHQLLAGMGMIRRRKSDVLQDLPDKVRRVYPCDLTDRSEYDKANRDFLGWLKQTHAHKVRRVKRVEKLARIGYLLRLAAKLKIRAVVDWANQFLDETDEKLILFAVHRKAIDVLQRRVLAKSVVVDGSVTGRRRQAAVNQFQKDPKTRVFVGNIKAAGVGITLTAASTVAFAEMYWRPGDHIQAEDRPHRIGQKSTVWIYYLVAGGTLEEQLCKILQEKQEVISSVLDGKPMPQDLNLYDELLDLLEGET